MSLRDAKLFIGFFVLLAYMGIGIFGLSKFNHTKEVPMPNCPYTQNSSSLCKSSLDHINDWRQYSNVIFPSLFVFSLLFFGIILYFFGKQDFLSQRQFFYKWKHYSDNKKLYAGQPEIIRWLSLFINSPSFSYAA